MALIMEYGFEGNGQDSSGNGYHLTAEGIPGFDTGHSGQGLLPARDTESNYYYRQGIGSGTLNEYTLMFWVYKNNNITGAVVNFNHQLWARLTSSSVGLLSGSWYSWTGGVESTENSVPQLAWIHVAFTRVSDGTGRVYINGVLDTSDDSGIQALDRTWELLVGFDYGFGSINGVIDEVRLFDTALSAGEITSWMATPVGGGSGPSAVNKMRIGDVPPPALYHGGTLVARAYLGGTLIYGEEEVE